MCHKCVNVCENLGDIRTKSNAEIRLAVGVQVTLMSLQSQEAISVARQNFFLKNQNSDRSEQRTINRS